MKYLTQILDKPLVSPNGERLGKIIDAVATLEGRLPAVRALVARINGSEVYLPYDVTDFDEDPEGPTGSGQIQGDIRLLKSLNEVAPYQPQNDDLRLRRDVLDKQI